MPRHFAASKSAMTRNASIEGTLTPNPLPLEREFLLPVGEGKDEGLLKNLALK